jgi:peptide/nickel transport system substrate-binding protein
MADHPDPVGDIPPKGLTRQELIVRGALGAGAAGLFGGGLAGRAAAALDRAKIKRGGSLTVAVIGDPAADALNPIKVSNGGEYIVARRAMLFEGLTAVDPKGRITNVLAQEFSHNKNASVWKIRIRDGVQWHDGSPFTADDVVYTLKYIIDPKNTAYSQASLSSVVTAQNIRALDPTTVELTLNSPLAILTEVFTDFSILMVKNGATDAELAATPNGTGPFKFVSWVPGQNTQMVRNPHYWKPGLPYLDGLELVQISDDTARFNALQTGQVGAISGLNTSFISSVKKNTNLRLLEHPGAAFAPLTMNVTAAPFTDVRVRQAFKYMTDREQMVRVALGGAGVVANDIQNALDPDRASYKEIPLRPHDPEKAKSLLKAAGHSNLTVTLTTGTVGTGSLPTSVLFAQQAKQAGVTVKLNTVPGNTYYSTVYLKTAFGTSFWGSRFLDQYISASYVKGGSDPETHYNSQSFFKLWQQYRAQVDAKKRANLALELQRIMWKDGGYIIPAFQSYVDAYSAKYGGMQSSVWRDFSMYNFSTAHLL